MSCSHSHNFYLNLVLSVPESCSCLKPSEATSLSWVSQSSQCCTTLRFSWSEVHYWPLTVIVIPESLSIITVWLEGALDSASRNLKMTNFSLILGHLKEFGWYSWTRSGMKRTSGSSSLMGTLKPGLPRKIRKKVLCSPDFSLSNFILKFFCTENLKGQREERWLLAAIHLMPREIPPQAILCCFHTVFPGTSSSFLWPSRSFMFCSCQPFGCPGPDPYSTRENTVEWINRHMITWNSKV